MDAPAGLTGSSSSVDITVVMISLPKTKKDGYDMAMVITDPTYLSSNPALT